MIPPIEVGFLFFSIRPIIHMVQSLNSLRQTCFPVTTLHDALCFWKSSSRGHTNLNHPTCPMRLAHVSPSRKLWKRAETLLWKRTMTPHEGGLVRKPTGKRRQTKSEKEKGIMVRTEIKTRGSFKSNGRGLDSWREEDWRESQYKKEREKREGGPGRRCLPFFLAKTCLASRDRMLNIVVPALPDGRAATRLPPLPPRFRRCVCVVRDLRNACQDPYLHPSQPIFCGLAAKTVPCIHVHSTHLPQPVMSPLFPRERVRLLSHRPRRRREWRARPGSASAAGGCRA